MLLMKIRAKSAWVCRTLYQSGLVDFRWGITRDRCDQDVYVIALSSFRTFATTVETSAQLFL